VIKYLLQCSEAHEFEAWFASSTRYEAQAGDGGVSCPHCGSTDVTKAIMSPNVGRRADKADTCAVPHDRARQIAMMRQLRNALLTSSEEVGARFPEEARKMHYGETEPRSIRGEVSHNQARELIDEGIDVFALPPAPEEMN
jgi:hypothetical protein